jgi:tyrosine-protein kinase Etk/Wzc
MAGNGLFQTCPGEPEEINIKDLLIKYLRYWYFFVICVVLCLAAAFFHIRYNTTPEYYVSSTLLIKSSTSNPVLAGGLSEGSFTQGMDKSIGNEMIILQSRNLMHRVLSELSLNTSYFVEGRLRNVEVYEEDLPINLIISKLDSLAFGKSIKIHILDNNHFEVIEEGIDGEIITSNHKFGEEISKKYATFTVIGSADMEFSKEITVQFHDIRKLAESYSQRLKIVLETKDANVLRLSLTDAVPQRSIKILNKIVEVYNKEAIEDKNQVELSTIEFLDERIQFLSTELSDVEKDVEQYKQQKNLTDIGSNAQIYLQSASEYNKELENFELQLEIINSLEDYLGQEEIKLVPSSLNIEDVTLNGLISKFNELQLERQRMLRTIQPGSSLIVNIEDQLANLRVNIRENLRNIKSGLVITRDNLQSSSAQFQSKIRQVPSIERELLEINRQQSIKQAIYLFLLQKREEAGLSLASTMSQSRIIDSATADDYPFNSQNVPTFLAALVMGLLIPFSVIFLKTSLNDKVTEKKEVEHLANVPILGEIVHSDNQGPLQITEGNNSVIAETFRLVRANLQFASLGNENKVLLVTSSDSGEGKTFVSINLGASLALSGKRVLLMGFDLRKPRLMKALGLNNLMGITDYLISNELSAESLIVPLKGVEDLYLIGAGTLPPNPAELMMSTRVKQLMDELRRQFDYIILDSPPVGRVADVFSLVPYIDSTLYIIRYNYTTKTQLAILKDLHQNKKLKHLNLILNDAKQYNGNAYAYGYGNGVHKKKRFFQKSV